MKSRKTAHVVMGEEVLMRGTRGGGTIEGWRLKAGALLAAVACLVFASAQLASAQVVEGFELTIPLDTVAYIPYDSHRVLATEPVPAEFAGQSCSVIGDSRNQDSVHPDNDLWVESGSSMVILHNVEDEPGGTVHASGTLVLGSEVTVTLHMGPDGIFSAGLDVVIDCAQSGSTTTTTTLATTTTSVAGTTVTAPPEETTTTVVDDDVLGTVITSTTVADEVEDLEVLPFTGSRGEALIFVAAGLLALGGILLVAARRQES